MKQSLKNSLTTEPLSGKFNSSFKLVNYAIDLAKNMIQTGRDCRVGTSIKNPAFWVLLEISTGKDTFDEVAQGKQEEGGRGQQKVEPKKVVIEATDEEEEEEEEKVSLS